MPHSTFVEVHTNSEIIYVYYMQSWLLRSIYMYYMQSFVAVWLYMVINAVIHDLVIADCLAVQLKTRSGDF